MSKMTISFEIVKNNDNSYLYNMYYPDLGLNDKVNIDNDMLSEFLTPLLSDLKHTLKVLSNVDVEFDDIFLGGGVYKHNAENFKEVVFNGSFQLTFDDCEINIENDKHLLSDVVATFLKNALNQEAIGMNYIDVDNGLDTFFVQNQNVTLDGVTNLYTKIISSTLMSHLDNMLTNTNYENLSQDDISIIDDTIALIDEIDKVSVESVLEYLDTFDKTFSRGAFKENGIKDCIENYMDNLLIVPAHNSTLMVTTFDNTLFEPIKQSLDTQGLNIILKNMDFN